MSLEGVGNAAVRAKKTEIANCEQTRRLRLRELYSVTAYLNSTPHLLDFSFNYPPNASEQRFLDENDITKGRAFNEDTLPWPPQRVTSEPKSPRGSEPPLSTKLYNKTKSSVEFNDRNQLVPEIPVAQELKATYPNPGVVVDGQSTTFATEEERKADVAQDGKPATIAKKLSINKPQSPTIRPGQFQASGAQPGILNGSVDTSNTKFAGDDEAFALSLQKEQAEDQLSFRVAQKLSRDSASSRSERLGQAKRKAAQDQVIGPYVEDQQLQAPTPAFQLDINSSSLKAGAWSPITTKVVQHSTNINPDDENSVNAAQAVVVKRDERIDGLVSDPVRTDAARTTSLPPSIAPQPVAPATPDAQLRLEEQQASASEQKKALSASMKETNMPESIADNGTSDTSGAQGASLIGIETVSSKSFNSPNSNKRLPGESETVEYGDTVNNGRLPSEEMNNALNTASQQHGQDWASNVADRDVEMHDVPSKKLTTLQRDASNDLRNQEVLSAEKIIKNEECNGILQVESQRTAKDSPVMPEPKLAGRNRQSKLHRRTSSKSTKMGLSPTKVGPAKSVDSPYVDPEYVNLKGAAEEGRDYLLPLFQWQAYQPPRATPLLQLLGTSHKVLNTSSHFAGLREEQDARLLRRIHQLQSTNRWSFRQLEKCQEPPVKSHLDFLLGEMRWLQVDFEQERKWKSAAALNLALWCAEWVHSSPRKRRGLQVKVKSDFGMRKLHKSERSATIDVANGNSDISQKGNHPEETASEGDFDILHPDTPTSPASLQLGHGDVVLYVEPTSESNDLLEKIPWYDPDKDVTPRFNSESLSSDRSPSLLPVSKFINGKLVPLSNAPIRKRSRYEYEEEEEEEASGSSHHKRISSIDSIHSIHSVRSMSMLTSGRVSRTELPPEQIEVALFNPENKHVRDRLHAGHAFRPPSEFGMPSTSFFESRISSQWLWDEDQKLRSLVREYSYNWSLISASLALPSAFTSGAERRTPWECFERWVQLEGLPAEMSKTPYFKTYQSRLEAAQRTVSAQHQAAQQQAQQQTQISGQQQLGASARRRTTQPIRVERRKNTRYLAWIDCMRKIARRRETLQHKQQEAAKAAAMRKAHETVQPKGHVHTPQQLSQMKYERECKLQQGLELHRQKVVAQQREAAIQRLAQQNRQQQALSNGHGVQQRHDGPNIPHVPNITNNAISSGLMQVAPNMQVKPPITQQGKHPNVPPGPVGHVPMGIPQGSMQMNLQDQSRSPQLSENARIALQQRALQASSQQYQLQQHQQHINQTGGAPSVQLPNTGGNMPSIMPPGLSNTNANGNSNPAAMIVNMGKNSGASPRTGQPGLSHHTQAQALSSGLIPAINHITHQVQTQNPRMSPEQVRQITNERLKGQIYQQTRQNALNAAAGAISANSGSPNAYSHQNGLPINGSPATQQYQQQLRQQMMQQRPQQSASPIMSIPRPASGHMMHHNPQQQQQAQHPQVQAQSHHQQQQQLPRPGASEHASPLQRPVQPSQS